MQSKPRNNGRPSIRQPVLLGLLLFFGLAGCARQEAAAELEALVQASKASSKNFQVSTERYDLQGKIRRLGPDTHLALDLALSIQKPDGTSGAEYHYEIERVEVSSHDTLFLGVGNRRMYGIGPRKGMSWGRVFLQESPAEQLVVTRIEGAAEEAWFDDQE